MNDNAPISNKELMAALAGLEQRLRDYFGERADNTETRLRAYIDERTQSTETRLKEYIDQRTQVVETGLKEYIDERTHDAETRLLRAFGDYQEAETTRFRHLKADLGNLNVSTDERLAALERRMTEINKRLIQKGI